MLPPFLSCSSLPTCVYKRRRQHLLVSYPMPVRFDSPSFVLLKLC
jgi:hypothetical protein